MNAQAPQLCSLCASPLMGGELACGDCGRPVARGPHPAPPPCETGAQPYETGAQPYESGAYEQATSRQLIGFLVSDEHPRADYWPLRLGANDVGRSPQLCREVCLPQETVSLRHATLTADGQGYTLTDNGSTNGTYLNGQLVPPDVTVPVRDGDTLCFGDYRVFLVDVWMRMR